MRLIDCANCGSKELAEEDGFIVCIYCKTKYVPEADDVPNKKTVIGIASDIQVLLNKCKIDPANRRRYANLVLDIDPNNTEAKQYIF
jgi:hypothetical protein